MTLVQKLVNIAFFKSEDIPTFDVIKEELINQPSEDHQWYLILSDIHQFEQQPICVHLIQSIIKLSTEIIQMKVTFSDALRIKAQTEPLRRVFIKYLDMVMKHSAKELL